MRLIFPIIMLLIYAALEYYGWQALKTALAGANIKAARWIYWGATFTLVGVFLLYRPLLYDVMPKEFFFFFAILLITSFVAKLVILLFLLPEDITRLIRFVFSKFSSEPPVAGGITRSVFFSRLALLTAAVPVGGLIYGVIANAYNYQFRKVKLAFPNLPAAFDGFRIVQISDIHSGSFTRTEPLVKAVEKINALNADVILFTGDLVNNAADEMESFMDVFDKLRAKHGVFSVTGNHDYGDYVSWNSVEEKRANFNKLIQTHANLGWDLLMNENRIIEKDGEKISILGVENWGMGTWGKHGKLDVAYKGTEGTSFKVLMSHNPQHWDAIVRPEFPDIDLTLSGHTHGAQFGVEEKWLRWSPVQWVYKQWAGLYQEGQQYLYVNRGFGFLFYPGRVGILPEVTEFTLTKA